MALHACLLPHLTVHGVLGGTVVQHVEAHVRHVAHLDGAAVATVHGGDCQEHVGGLPGEGASPVSACVCAKEEHVSQYPPAIIGSGRPLCASGTALEGAMEVH